MRLNWRKWGPWAALVLAALGLIGAGAWIYLAQERHAVHQVERELQAIAALKVDQIAATGATYCIAPCHNCHSQIHDIGEHFESGYHTVHLWTLICLAMGVLGENERAYLGADLAEVGL